MVKGVNQSINQSINQWEFQWLPPSGSFIHCFQVKQEFGNVGFCEGRKSGLPRERIRINNKLNPDTVSTPGIDHTGWRRVLSPLCQPCRRKTCYSHCRSIVQTCRDLSPRLATKLFQSDFTQLYPKVQLQKGLMLLPSRRFDCLLLVFLLL